MEFNHYSVLLQECIDALNIDPNGIYVDGTAGGAGHSREIAKRLTTGRLISIDKDPDAIAVATERLAPYPCAQVVQGDFADMDQILANLRIDQVNGILLDLGVSSHQLDRGERGFSYNVDAPLDMRMSQSGLSARDIVNTYSVDELTRSSSGNMGRSGLHIKSPGILKNAGHRPPSKPPLSWWRSSRSRFRLRPAGRRTSGQAHLSRAIRIAVNSELDHLSQCLDRAFEYLAPGGRFAIITFHSLEDRMVKQKFADLAKGCICPPDFPVCVCGRTPRAKLVSRKPILPSEEELAKNNRSHSAKLRVCERI